MKNFSLYYVYLHLTLDTKIPFYIGIGTKQYGDNSNIKLKYARAYSKAGRSTFWKKVVNKHNYSINILLESNDYEYVKNQEKYFISYYGRRDQQKGILVNLTDGGDGMLGHKFSDLTKKKMSDKAKENLLLGKSALSNKDYSKHSEKMKGNKYAVGTKLTLEQKLNLQKNRFEKTYKRVIQENLDGSFVKEWFLTTEAATFYKCTYKAIWKACKNYHKKEKCKGFLWKFKE